MAQNITLLGANYSAVPAVTLPKTGGGTAKFIEENECITCYTRTSAPPSSLGKNGDVCLVTSGVNATSIGDEPI